MMRTCYPQNMKYGFYMAEIGGMILLSDVQETYVVEIS